MKNDHNNEQSIGDKEESQQHETNSKTDRKHQDAKKTKEAKVVKETQEKDAAPEEQKSTANCDVDDTKVEEKQSKLHSYAQSLKSLCCRVKTNFLKLPRKQQIGFIAGVVLAFIVVIILLSLISMMSSGSVKPVHANQSKPVKHQISIGDGNQNQNNHTGWATEDSQKSNDTMQVRDGDSNTSLAVDLLEHQQKNMLDTQKIILSRLDTLSRQLAAVASNDQNATTNETLKALKSDNKNLSTQVTHLNNTVEQLSEKVTTMTQVFATHNSAHVTLIDNPGFTLSSIMWLNNQPKAVVYSKANKGDQMLSIGERIGQWTLVNIDGGAFAICG